jgi:hypothetical protein
MKLASAGPGAGPPPSDGLLQNAMESAVASLADYVRAGSAGAKIYLTGPSAGDARLAPLLSRLLGEAQACESLEAASANAPSTAIAGLKKAAANPVAFPPLLLEVEDGRGLALASGRAAWKWAAAAALLAVAVLFFPDAESLLLKTHLEKKLASLKADHGRLEMIDQELAFLQNLKQEQPPYLEMLYLLASAAPQGTRLEPLSLARKGEISLRTTMANGQQVTDFRSKLIDSGWFANVVVEEQTPTPDRRVAVRLTAQLNPPEARKPLPAESKKPAAGSGEAKTPPATNSPAHVPSKT